MNKNATEIYMACQEKGSHGRLSDPVTAHEHFFENHNSFEKSFDSVTVFDNYAVYSAINSFEQAEIFLSNLKRVWGNP